MNRRSLLFVSGCLLALFLTVYASGPAERAKDIFPIGLGGFEGRNERWMMARRLQGIDLCGLGHNPFDPAYYWGFHEVELLPDTLEKIAPFGFVYSVTPQPLEKFWHWKRDTTTSEWLYHELGSEDWFDWRGFNDLVADSAAYVDAVLQSASSGYRAITDYWLWHEPYKWGGAHHDMRDSIGVFPIMKWQIEQETDSLHSPFTFFCCREDTIRHHCFMHYTEIDTSGADTTTYDNQAYYFSVTDYPCDYGKSVGDSNRFWYFSARIDSASRIGREALSADPCRLRPFMDTWAEAGHPSWPHRYSTPEELCELVNLGILHGAKGFNYFNEGSGEELQGLLDELLVPWDVPYEEYVYQRHHDWYAEPDTFHPFGDDSGIVDPYRALPVKPDPDTLEEKGWEIYYTWKYAPYGRNFRALGSINRPVHKMKDKLRHLWDADSSVAELSDTPYGCGEIITLSDDPRGGIASDGRVALFFVSKDFWNGDTLQYGKQTFSVCIDTLKLPSRFHPVNSYCKPLDIEERRVRPWYGQPPAGQRGFRVDLTTGQGKLVELMTGSEVRDFTVADPDIYFTDPPDTSEPDSVRYFLGTFAGDEDFVVGDTVALCAKIFNIGFTSADSVTVIFYDGDPRDGIDEIAYTNIALPALSDTNPSMAIAHVQWQLNAGSAGPHDIHVVVNHQYVETDAGYTRQFYRSEADSSNDHAHALLYVYPVDYPSEEFDNPWDMDEESGYTWLTPDIDTVIGAVSEPTDSITGVAELQIAGMPEPDDTMEVFLNVGWPGSYVDPDMFPFFSTRIFVSGPCSLQVIWYDDYSEKKGTPVYPGPIPLVAGQWNVKRIDLMGDENSTWLDTSYVTRFGFRVIGRGMTFVRVSWAKLTRE